MIDLFSRTRSACIHEAGHAVCAIELASRRGLEPAAVVRELLVVGDRGRCFWGASFERLSTVDRLAAVLAGPIAEDVACPLLSGSSLRQSTAASDRRRAVELVHESFGGRVVYPEETEPWQAGARLARRVVLERWPAIERVARAIEKTGELSGREVVELVRRERSTSPPRPAAAGTAARTPATRGEYLGFDPAVTALLGVQSGRPSAEDLRALGRTPRAARQAHDSPEPEDDDDLDLSGDWREYYDEARAQPLRCGRVSRSGLWFIPTKTLNPRGDS